MSVWNLFILLKLNQGCLRQLIQGPLPLVSEEDKVKDMVSSVGWNWARIPFELPSSCKKEIQATPFALTGTSQGRLIWVGSRGGEFDLKSAYIHAADLGSPRQFHGNWVWTIKTLPRIQSFLWKCCHDSIDVKERLVTRGMVMDLTCPLCHNDVESITHALRDCPVGMHTWNLFGIPYSSNTFFSQSIHTWLVENCTVERGYARCSIPWKVLFPLRSG